MLSALSICVVLFAAFPTNYNPWRNMFFLFFYEDSNFSQKANVTTTVIFVALTCTVAVFYPNVSTVLSILGGSCSVSICYTIPSK